MGENESSDADDEQETELIGGAESDKKTGQEEEGEGAEQKHSADKSPLFADGGENVIIMHSGSGKKPELDLRIRRLESFSGPTARADRDK